MTYRHRHAKYTMASHTDLECGVSHELVARPILSMKVDRASRKAQEHAVTRVWVCDVDSRVLQQPLNILQVALDVG